MRTSHSILTVSLAVLLLTLAPVAAAAPAPADLRIAHPTASVLTAVVRHFGWAEQEFAKINQRIVWSPYGDAADTLEAFARGETGAAVLALDRVSAADDDTAARLNRVYRRAYAWTLRHPDTALALAGVNDTSAGARAALLAALSNDDRPMTTALNVATPATASLAGPLW